ncbi:MAG: hypothetical protein J2P36_12770, partial [Ktedonobacteraceae bacterium]|nr:hypothetical protein [Ktedonobacteraceae bacterium]
MDPITTAIVGALAAGALSGLSKIGETALFDAYTHLKSILTRKFGARSGVMQALVQLENKPASTNRQGVLHEELAAVNAGQDAEVRAAATHLRTVIQQHQSINLQNASVKGSIYQVGGNQYLIGRDQVNINAGDLVGPGPRRTARNIISILLIIGGLITSIPAAGTLPFFEAIVNAMTQPVDGFPEMSGFNAAANGFGTAAHVMIYTIII